MATNHGTASVGTVAVELVGPASNSQYVYVQNADYDGSAEIYVGGSTVGTASGFRVTRGVNTVFQIEGGDSLYAIADTDATPVRYLTVRQ